MSTTTIIGYKYLLSKSTQRQNLVSLVLRRHASKRRTLENFQLPGLVLLAYDQNKQYIFNAMGMSTLNGTESITFTEKAREKVTQKDYEAKHKFDGAEALKATRKTGFS